jgi:hypothetical protein
MKRLLLAGLMAALVGCDHLVEREAAVGLLEPHEEVDPAHVEAIQEVAIQTAVPGGQLPYPEGINLDRQRLALLLDQVEQALDAGDRVAAAAAIAEARAHVAAIAAADIRLTQEVRPGRTAKGTP